jgi:hypothetical protein
MVTEFFQLPFNTPHHQMAIKNIWSSKGVQACAIILGKNPCLPFWGPKKIQLSSKGGVCWMAIEKIWSPST